MNNKTKKTKKVIVVKWEHILKNVKSFLKKKKKKRLWDKEMYTTNRQRDTRKTVPVTDEEGRSKKL